MSETLNSKLQAQIEALLEFEQDRLRGRHELMYKLHGAVIEAGRQNNVFENFEQARKALQDRGVFIADRTVTAVIDDFYRHVGSK